MIPSLIQLYIVNLTFFQVMTLLMLAFRMRGVAVKSILCKPCALLAAITSQAIIMPLVSAK